ncbi:MAG: hypothetical protein ABIL62_05135 [Planctomycetota bacterium]
MCRKMILFVLVLALAGTNVVFGGMVVEIGITNSNDDVEDQLASGMYITSSDLELPDGQVIGLRFLNVEVPNGAKIIEAYIVFTVDELKGGTEPVNLIIDGEPVPDAPPFADVMYNVRDRARTTAKAVWVPENWTVVGNKHQTSDISAVISEIVSQEGWNPGNALVLIISDDPDNPSKGIRCAESGTGAPAPLLHIEFTTKRAIAPDPANGVYIDDTWASLSWVGGETAASRDVYFSDNFDDVDARAESAFQGNQVGTFFVVGFPGMPYPDGLVPGTTYYWCIDEIEADGTTKHEGKVWSFTVPPKTAYFPDPADSAESVEPDVKLSWTPGFGGKLHTVYFGDNFDDVNNAAGGLPQGATTYTPGTLKLAGTYYWRVDEFDPPGTYKGDVWSFTTQGAVGSPDPSNGSVDVKQTQILKWSPSVFAASHELYFGTDKDAVKNADTGSPEYKGTRDLGAESYDPGMLEWDTAYYWRIDEVNNTNPDSPWTGILWSFTTANFLVVDDFESYNDLDPADPDSNRIFNVWIDGYGVPTNGSLVGYENPPFAEQTIVHGGSQSMPLYYDNSVGYSEATLTLTYPRDWTEKGVNTLTIWFRGDSANAAETLYVALNGSAVVNHDNPNAAQVDTWTEWNIDLQAFADQGVSLANVNTIALGLGNRNNPVAGGSGTMYFDDIRLYPPPEPAP